MYALLTKNITCLPVENIVKVDFHVRVVPDLSIWGDRSIVLADRSPKGVRRDRFIDSLAVSMRSNFQFHVISRIDIGLFC